MQNNDVGYDDFQTGRLPPSHMKFELTVIGELIGSGNQPRGRLHANDTVDLFNFSEPAANRPRTAPEFHHYRAAVDSQVTDITF